MEIERKFLMKSPPPLEPISEYVSSTVYLFAGLPEVRVRKYTSGDYVDYLLTIKGDGDLERKEVETYIDAKTYNDLLDLVFKCPIIRHGKLYNLDNGLILEYSTVDIGQDTCFNCAEIEFKTKQQALDFIVPEYLGKEVTFDPKYKIRNYWLETRGKEK